MSVKHIAGSWEAGHVRTEGEPSDGPGHWTIIAQVAERDGYAVFGSVGDTLNRDHRISPEEDAAHARLIAAAPELLALAKQYASECGECDGAGVIEIEKTRPGCCGNARDDGSCCGNPIPELYAEPEQCPACADIRAVIAKAEAQS